MWLRILGIMFIACFLITGCLKQSGYRDVSVSSILLPGDTVISCCPFKPTVNVLYSDFHAPPVVCTLSARIWRYEIELDSLGSVSMDTTKPIIVYDTFVVATIMPGINTVTLPAWHPFWSDIYWVGQHHKIEVTAHVVKDWIRSNNVFIDDFIVKARNHDLQVNYVGLLKDRVVVVPEGESLIVGVAYNPVSVVSNSPFGPTASFRSWYKVIRVNTNTLVYSRYLNRTLAAGQDTCIYYQSGWVPSDSGWYKVTSWIQTGPSVDSIPDNNYMERCFYAKLTTSNVGLNKNTQDDIGNLQKLLH